MNTFYKAPWGLAVKIVTVVALIIALACLWMVLSVPFYYNSYVQYLVGAMPPVLLLGLWLRRVKSYKIIENKIQVSRGLGKKSFDLDKLIEVQKPFIQFLKLKRIWGNAGLFSFTGKFSYPKLGKFHCYVTDWEKAVFLRGEDFSLMLSPDKEEEFLDRISDVLNQKKASK